MDFLTFLNTMRNSLNQIEVKGKENLDTLFSCILATESMIDSIKNMANKEIDDGGELADGRRSDNSTDSCIECECE